jgi:hypothetical protein
VLPNCWVSARPVLEEPTCLALAWDAPQRIQEVRLFFDSDLDRHLSTMWVHYEDDVVPELVRDYRLEYRRDGVWTTLCDVAENHQRLRVHRFDAVEANGLRLVVTATNGTPRAHVYEVRVY